MASSKKQPFARRRAYGPLQTDCERAAFERAQMLQTEGCTEVQDFYFNEPRPAHDVAAMLEAKDRIHLSDGTGSAS